MNRKRRHTAAKAGRGATPAPARASVEAGDTLEKAQALHESGQFEDAAALYGRILGQDPRRSDVFHRIGVDAVDKGVYGVGAALIRKAIEANPAVASYHVDLAHALEIRAAWRRPWRPTGGPWRSTPGMPARTRISGTS